MSDIKYVVYDEFANWDGIDFKLFHFVQETKKPKWFWKIFRWCYSKITGKHIIVGTSISTDFGMENPAYQMFLESDKGVIYIS